MVTSRLWVYSHIVHTCQGCIQDFFLGEGNFWRRFSCACMLNTQHMKAWVRGYGESQDSSPPFCMQPCMYDIVELTNVFLHRLGSSTTSRAVRNGPYHRRDRSDDLHPQSPLLTSMADRHRDRGRQSPRTPARDRTQPCQSVVMQRWLSSKFCHAKFHYHHEVSHACIPTVGVTHNMYYSKFSLDTLYNT